MPPLGTKQEDVLGRRELPRLRAAQPGPGGIALDADHPPAGELQVAADLTSRKRAAEVLIEGARVDERRIRCVEIGRYVGGESRGHNYRGQRVELANRVEQRLAAAEEEFRGLERSLDCRPVRSRGRQETGGFE
jgi:hypothetical protein